MKSWSLATRIVSSVLSAVTLSLLALSLAVAGFTRHEITERLDNSLQEVSERLQATVAAQPHGSQSDNVAWVPDVGPRTLAYQVVDQAGHVVLRSQNAPVRPFVSDIRTGFTSTPHFRVYVAAPTMTAYRVLVGEPTLHRRGATWRATAIAVMPVLMSLPVIWWLVRLIVRRALRPLDRLHDEMQSRGSGNLRPVPSLDLPVELVPIQHAVNTLLSRLETALSTERAFAASAAHELRNPLAALLAQVQMLGRMVQPDPEAGRRVDIIAERTRRLGRTVEKLLQFSRATSGIAFRRNRFDLLTVVHVLVDDLGHNPHDGQGIILTPNGISHIFVHGDMDATGIMLRNLLENALLHGKHGTPVRVTVLPDGGIDITNDCPALPPDMLDRLTSPFVRGGTGTHGSGLGLAIASNIATQMDATLRLRSPLDGSGRGFGVCVTFPGSDMT
ncbi:sensor histidine kinase [Komagataeibacter oboediens]|uniref:histidine kinase n=1 Tax=Komagataeibacter oboediens TaxID=65958 RepID=A0ABS5SP05_9PROT|nr:HAMP domain-containing sensor histidine kinase [Komagataeibacter oboediens]MBL7234097.1 HAMP domain-containing histidine kinase [Komagataeibacter oboediens]MBT0676007.1 HAMP domain-containing histidine kinase [Komagataeibacter oboediens]MBT0679151.1 HAMP domain-containing histidine kinase [Komagataeibacter oboediens]